LRAASSVQSLLLRVPVLALGLEDDAGAGVGALCGEPQNGITVRGSPLGSSFRRHYLVGVIKSNDSLPVASWRR
jgi:hypothetical protein